MLRRCEACGAVTSATSRVLTESGGHRYVADLCEACAERVRRRAYVAAGAEVAAIRAEARLVRPRHARK